AHLRAEGATVTHVGAVTVRIAEGAWKARASAAGDAIEIVVAGRDDDQVARLLDAAESALAGSGVLAMAGEISGG
ncbi:MAG: hypothetical protein H7X93_14900, partial [Sphingomonadaceae bacterium]|nr:hypothetical protein [Sphingomonadaceae bacterium]